MKFEKIKESAQLSPGIMVHNLCQLKRCSKIFESSVTIASKSFSGFHSAIFIYESNIKHQKKCRERLICLNIEDVKIKPGKQQAYQIVAETEAPERTHQFPYLTLSFSKYKSLTAGI